MKTTTQEQDMTTDTNILPVTAEIVWHGSAQGQTPFAFFDHDGEAYHLRLVEGGVDILREIDGEDCYIAQVDTVTEARAFISVYAGQLI
jgi:hypothetical protein